MLKNYFLKFLSSIKYYRLSHAFSDNVTVHYETSLRSVPRVPYSPVFLEMEGSHHSRPRRSDEPTAHKGNNRFHTYTFFAFMVPMRKRDPRSSVRWPVTSECLIRINIE